MKQNLPGLITVIFLSLGLAHYTAFAENGTKHDELTINNVWHKAKLRGVSFRAVGQEPGWLLEITAGKEILLITDYGQKKTVYPYVQPKIDNEQRQTIHTIEDQKLEIIIRGEDCSDIMSGEKYAVSVLIQIDNKQLRGCGRALH